MNQIIEEILEHTGVARRSGRYPWGSGKDPHQRTGDFISRVETLRKAGMSDKEIAGSMGLTHDQFRTQHALADSERMKVELASIKSLREDGLTFEEIGKRMGYESGSSVRSLDFVDRVEEMKKKGMSEKEIADNMGLTSGQYRIQRTMANSELRKIDVAIAKNLRAEGHSLDQIAKKMGFENDSSVRSLLDEKAEERMNASVKTAMFIKDQVDKHGMFDVGKDVNLSLNISAEKLKEALYILELQGYPTWGGRMPQVTNPGKMTTLSVICPPGTPHKDIFKLDQIHTFADKYVSHDGGETFDPFVYPKSMDSNRIKINYAEDGGEHKDGVIEIRRGVEDLSLGKSHYAQVRILVDDTHYLKGMAIYSDDLPPGVDILFNTNKKKGTPKMDVLKEIKKDPDNPFGSLIKAGGQSYYIDKDGNRQLSLINKRAEEGDWGDWTDHLPSQFLSKQPQKLIDKQLNLAIADKTAEYESIMALTNPTVKKVMLRTFSDDCDSAAVHLQAAALPRQKYKVILPVGTLKDTEVYAPTFENGEKVALVRFPHAGTFEIPILTVNNKHKDAERILGNAADAVGINSKVAERLSGADFDGDTVMVIPTGGKVNILSTPQLKELENFDAKAQYGPSRVEKDADGNTHYYRNDIEYRVMKKTTTQTQMGIISNLITDMTLKGAPPQKMARAVKHSMVVIDAEKHKLDYRQSEIDNGIALLKKEYQGHIGEDGQYHEGASTLISRAKSEESVLKRKGSPIIDKDTGEVSYKLASDPYEVVRYQDPETGKLSKLTKFQMQQYKSAVAQGKPTDNFVIQTKSDGEYDLIKYKDPISGKISPATKEQKKEYYKALENGESVENFKVETKIKMQASTQMAETKDAYALSSGRPQEEAYAEYANQMKALANAARKQMMSTQDIKYSSSAKETYAKEVKSLDDNLRLARMNGPRERYAQAMANAIMKAKKEDNPDMTKAEIKKASQQQLVAARNAIGAERHPIPISDREWEAIQAGAVSPSKLMDIINHVDPDTLRQRATPRAVVTLTPVQKNKIKALVASGYNSSEIAEALHKSPNTINDYLLGKGVNKDNG